MSFLSKTVSKAVNSVKKDPLQVVNPSAILPKVLSGGKLDAKQITGMQLAMGGAALAGNPVGVFGSTQAAMSPSGPGTGLDPADYGATGSVDAGSVSRPGVARMSGFSSFNPWSMLAPVIGAGADIWSANKMAQGQQEANATNLQSAREQMQFQAQQTSQQEAFQSQMSNTAHQREVADLKAAGLNPVLSANSGASTPVGASGSGAMATVQNAAPNYGGIVPKGVDTAVKLKQMQKDFESADSQIYLNEAAANREDMNARVAQNSARKIAADADVSELSRDYVKRHPWVFGSGQWIKHLSPFATSAGSLGTLIP